MIRLWEIFAIDRGRVQTLGVVSEGWLDEWAGRMFDKGWVLEPVPGEEWYKLINPASTDRYFEVYRTNEWE